MKEEDDEVVQEIPVYSSKNLAGKLYVYQYPNEIGDLESSPVISSSVKLANREVCLEVAIDTESNNYDTYKGEIIGKDANGEPPNDPKKPHEKYFRKNIMDRIKLQSRQAVPEVSNLVVGVLHNKELHITPLKAIVDLRKSLSYLDQADKLAKNVAKEQGLAENSGDEEEEAKQVTVKFARQDNDRVKQIKERSFRFLSKRSAEEPWHHTEYHGSSTHAAQSERQRLYCGRQVNTLLDVGDGDGVARRLATLDVSSDVGPEGDEPLSLVDFRKLPTLIDKIKALLVEVHLIRWTRLVALLALEQEAVDALRAVQQAAVLVRGNWAVRSELLYKRDGPTPPGEVPARLMAQARDYALYLLATQSDVDRSSIITTCRVPPSAAGDVLATAAVVDPATKRWRLRLPPDDEFIARYPEVAQRQALQWEMRLKQVTAIVSPSRTRRKSNRDSSVSEGEEGEKKVKRRGKRSGNSASESEGEGRKKGKGLDA